MNGIADLTNILGDEVRESILYWPSDCRFVNQT